MPGKYRNPPVAEAVCAFTFASSTPWDMTIPGRLYELVREDYPHTEPLTVAQVTVDLTGQRISQQQQPGVRFLTEDRHGIVQLGPDQLSIHRVNKYQGWTNFRPQILRMLDLYRQIANPIAATRIGLRYVNHVELPKGQIEFDDYFNVMPRVPEPIPQSFAAFLAQIQIPYGGNDQQPPESLLRVLFGTAQPEQSEQLRFILDLDMATVDVAVPPLDTAMDWLDTAHARLDEAFTAAFTDKTHREIFGENLT